MTTNNQPKPVPARHTVTVDLCADDQALTQFKTAFPKLDIVASAVSSNDHAQARAFSHLATKWIEDDLKGQNVIIADIGSAPARRINHPEHVAYHSVCPRRCAEDPERLTAYARKLSKMVAEGSGDKVCSRITDLKDILEQDATLETATICLNDDITCQTKADVAVYQDVYAMDAVTTLYAQADKGVRLVYWIGFDPYPFHTDAMAGCYPMYRTNWSDAAVLSAKNLPLCYSGLTDESVSWKWRFKDKPLKPTGEVHFSVGGTHYVEDRDKLKSWHLPSTFHVIAPNEYTMRCDTVISCGGYVVKKICISEGIMGEPRAEELAVTYHHDGIVVTKVTDTVHHETVSFPVITYVPATICDQMTAMTATPVKIADAVKLLVGLNQRIVANGTTVRNVNTMDNSLIPTFAQALCNWSEEIKRDLEAEAGLYQITSMSTWLCCCRGYDRVEQKTFYRRPRQSTGIYVPAKFTASLRGLMTATRLNVPLRKLLLGTLKGPKPATDEVVSVEDEVAAYEAADQTDAAADELAVTDANPPLLPTAPPLSDESDEEDEEEVEADGPGATIIDTSRGSVKVTGSFGAPCIGDYLLVSPLTVTRTRKLNKLLGPLAEEVMQYVHKGRDGRYSVVSNDLKILVPSGSALKPAHFQALAESATMVYNDYKFVNRHLDYLATQGPALNTDETHYRVIQAAAAVDEYVYSLSSKKCVKKEEATGEVMEGELCSTPYHQFAFEGLSRRPAKTYDVEIIGIYGAPGAGKTAIITSEVSKHDLVTSGKKENCEDIKKLVKSQRSLSITARTVDSVLYGGTRRPVDVLYVDEAYACHAGTLLALVATVKPATRVVLCGDPKQVGCINMLQMKMNYNIEIGDRVLYKNISRRCTLPLTAIVSTLNYDGKMRTVNPCTKPVIIDTESKYKPKPDALVLTCFRGWVKDLKGKYPANEVMTAAASQGLTRQRVFAERCRVTKNPLYEPNSEHITVLLTRTNEELIWKTLPNDPLIPILTKPPKGDFTATQDEWQREHDAILAVLRDKGSPRLDFGYGKKNTCWAVTSSKVLHAAGVPVTPADFELLFPAFKEDRPHSALAALDTVLEAFYGLDTTSGILSGKGSYMKLEAGHWSSSSRGHEYGLNLAALDGYAVANPRLVSLMRRRSGRQALNLEKGVLVEFDPTKVQVPMNRHVPHVLVDTSAASAPGFASKRLSVDRWDQEHQFKTRAAVKFAEMTKTITFNTVLDLGAAPGGVTEYCIERGKQVTAVSEKWDSFPKGATVVTADITVSIPSEDRFDLVFCDAASGRRYHHYAQCEDHAILLTSACRAGVACTKKGGSFIVKGFGLADRRSEYAIRDTARYFKKFKAVKPVSSRVTNVEVYFVFQGRSRPEVKNIGPLFCELDRIYLATRKAYKLLANGSVASKVKVAELLNPEVGSAPTYRVVNGNIAAAPEEVIVNAAHATGRPGNGVCGVLFAAFPDAFPDAAIGDGNAVHCTDGEHHLIHAVGPDYRDGISEEAGARTLYAAYQAIVTEMAEHGFTSVAVPLLSTGIFSNRADRFEQSLNAMTEAFDATNYNVVVYCASEARRDQLQALLNTHEEAEEFEDDDISVCSTVAEDVTWVPVHSELAGRPGYSTVHGNRRSLMVGTLFHNSAVAMSALQAAWPREEDGNRKIIEYIQGKTLRELLSTCPVSDVPVGIPPDSMPCGCRYAMTAERVTRLRQHSSESFVVCSSFPLPLKAIDKVTKIVCEKPTRPAGPVKRTLVEPVQVYRPPRRRTPAIVREPEPREPRPARSVRSESTASSIRVNLVNRMFGDLPPRGSIPRSREGSVHVSLAEPALDRHTPVMNSRAASVASRVTAPRSTASSEFTDITGSVSSRASAGSRHSRASAVRSRRHPGPADGAGSYIFSSDDGHAHLSEGSTQTNGTTEVLLKTSKLPDNDYGPLKPEEEVVKQLIYQMAPTAKNRSRYMSVKVRNMKHRIVTALVKGSLAYQAATEPIPLWKSTYPKPRYSLPVTIDYTSVAVAIRSANMFLQINYPLLTSFSITDKYDSYYDMVDGCCCNLDMASFDPAKLRSVPKKQEYQEPEVLSAVPGPLQNNLQNILMAATKRNCNVTQMRELPTLDSAAMNVEAFKEFACGDTDLWADFKEHPVTLSEKQIKEYVFHLQGAKANITHSRLENGCPSLDTIAMDRFTLDMKRDVKVTPGTKHVEERPKVQVIQAADPMATSYLCAIHRELVRRLKAVLLPNLHVLFDMSAEDFDAIIGHGMHAGDPVMETDISSFDKSQDKAMALTALMLLEDLGVSDPLLDLIEGAFGDITSVHLPTGTRFKFGSMMKSGLFLTLFVNTLLNVTIAARVLRDRLSESPCAAFIGDDNVVAGVVSTSDMVPRCASWMNMEVKVMDSVIGDNSPYFCGGFLILDSITGTVCRVSDPVKRLMKLGKPMLNDPDTDGDRCRALREEVQVWHRAGVAQALQMAVFCRYQVTNLPLATMAMATFAKSTRHYQATRGKKVTLYV
ncbi:non-structural protein [Comber alphavirus]|nr:non-structural protein [Comber alphavirus]